MTNTELIEKCKQILNECKDFNVYGSYALISELLNQYGGKNNSFLSTLKQFDIKRIEEHILNHYIVEIIKSFINYIEKGLYIGISPERKGQLDTVSEFLDQSNSLLNEDKIHPAAAAVLIGASLRNS